jgi:RNA polymerase sigma-70 factor (sigma-E family)
MSAADPGDVARHPVQATETTATPAVLVSVPVGQDADDAVTALYAAHYGSLVRLAALLVGGDQATAEEVVQDSFVAMHCAWRQLRNSDTALPYLLRTVVNRSRSVLRHRVVVDRNTPMPPPDMPSVEQGGIALLERSKVVAALRSLSPLQREALVLRYYGDLSEAQIASTMDISTGAVKGHIARAMSALHRVLENEA